MRLAATADMQLDGYCSPMMASTPPSCDPHTKTVGGGGRHVGRSVTFSGKGLSARVMGDDRLRFTLIPHEQGTSLAMHFVSFPTHALQFAVRVLAEHCAGPFSHERFPKFAEFC